MTNQKPTGVFVRLPLSADDIKKMNRAMSWSLEVHPNPTLETTSEAALLAIGTPVWGGELKVVAYDNIASGYLSRVEPVTPNINLVRQSDAQAQIAARDAEIVRLREENEQLKRKLKPQFYCSEILEESSMDTRESIAWGIEGEDGFLSPENAKDEGFSYKSTALTPTQINEMLAGERERCAAALDRLKSKESEMYGVGLMTARAEITIRALTSGANTIRNLGAAP